jgi:hypothetical protein
VNTTEEYVTELREALADLPPAEVDAIVEDIEPQLAESADGLGSPTALAAELRAAAGFPPAGGRYRVTARIALVVLVIATGTAGYAGFISHQLRSTDAVYSMPWIAVALVATWFVVTRFGPEVTAVGELPEVRATRTLLLGASSQRVRDALRLGELGWLLARFPLILVGVLMLAGQIGWEPWMAHVFAVAVALVATAAGYRSLTDRRWLWLSVPAGAFAIGAGLRVLVFVSLYAQGHIGYVAL